MKLLIFDIESFANIVYAWGTRKVYVQPSQIIRPQKVVCWSAKWYGEEDVMFGSIRNGPKAFIHKLHSLMSEADGIIGYNENRFDIPMMNTEFAKLGLAPPSPAKQIDLYTTVRRRFALPSYKLEYVAPFFGVGKKIDSGGQELWNACEKGDAEAWEKMQEYNIQDTLLLEPLYDILRPWIKNNLHHSVMIDDDGKLHCDHCGSTHLRYKGIEPHRLGRYKSYQCLDCGGWNRDHKNVGESKTRAIHAS